MKRKRKPLKKGLLFFLFLIALSFTLRIVAGLLLKEAKPVVTQEEEALRARALKIHHEAIVVDTHNDVPTWILDFGFDLGMKMATNRAIVTPFYTTVKCKIRSLQT